jgi:hypothetical protein
MRTPAISAIVFLLLGAAALLQPPARAATPATGTVGPATPSTTQWDFASVAGAGSGGTPIEVVCAPVQCDKYDLLVKLPQPDAVFYASHSATLKFRCTWDSPTPTDLDCFAFSPSGGETGPGKPDTSDSGANFEEIVINNPASGHWSLRADGAISAAPGCRSAGSPCRRPCT